MAAPQYRWPKHHPSGLPLNKWILMRDPHCRVNLPGCTHHPDCQGCSQVADHIIPASQGGDWFNEHNLRGACKPCNQARTRPHPQTTTPTPPERW